MPHPCGSRESRANAPSLRLAGGVVSVRGELHDGMLVSRRCREGRAQADK